MEALVFILLVLVASTFLLVLKPSTETNKTIDEKQLDILKTALLDRAGIYSDSDIEKIKKGIAKLEVLN